MTHTITSKPSISDAVINDPTGSKAPAALSRASRRGFLKSAAATAAGLTIGFHWLDPLSRALADTSKEFVPNAFLRIRPSRGCSRSTP